MKKVLTIQEINDDFENRKKITRDKLEKRITDIVKNYNNQDTVYVLSKIINNITL